MVSNKYRRRKFQNFVLKLILNRKVPTIFNIFEENIVLGSIIITDGYPSYPSTVAIFKSCHKVVNHSVEFINTLRVYTNQIENMWSDFKYAFQKHSDINKGIINLFLNTWH